MNFLLAISLTLLSTPALSELFGADVKDFDPSENGIVARVPHSPLRFNRFAKSHVQGNQGNFAHPDQLPQLQNLHRTNPRTVGTFQDPHRVVPRFDPLGVKKIDVLPKPDVDKKGLHAPITAREPPIRQAKFTSPFRVRTGYSPKRLVGGLQKLGPKPLPIERLFRPSEINSPLFEDPLGGYKQHESLFVSSDFAAHEKAKRRSPQAYADHRSKGNGILNAVHDDLSNNRALAGQQLGFRQRALGKAAEQQRVSHLNLGKPAKTLTLKDKEFDDNRETLKAKINAASVEENREEFKQAIDYKGGDVWAGTNGNTKAFNKGENYLDNSFHGNDTASKYKGFQSKLRREVKGINVKEYNVTHKTDYRNNFEDQNHEGQYKGQVFDVAFNSKNVEGGFFGNKKHTKFDEKARDKVKLYGDGYRKGKYIGGDHAKAFSSSKEGEYAEYPQHPPLGPYGHRNGEGHNENGKTITLEDQYTGAKHANGGKLNGAGRAGSFSAEGIAKRYGTHFLGKDEVLSKNVQKQAVQANKNAAVKQAFTHGSYKDIEAKGHNRNQEFQGDYKTKAKKQNVYRKTFHDENFYELGDPFPVSVKTEESFKNVEGQTFKGKFAEKGKDGKYFDQELQAEQDANKHQKAYKGDSFVSGFSGETAGIFFNGKVSELDRDNKRFDKRKEEQQNFVGKVHDNIHF